MIGGAVSYVWGSQASLLGRDLGLRRRWGVAGVGVGTDFVSLTTLWRAYRRQRYRSWSSADAEGAFCVVCVQFLALCRRWAQQASLLGQVLDCRRRRECTQWCWSASVWQLGAAGGGSHESHSNSPLIDHLGVHPNTWGAPPFFLLCYGVPVAFFSVIF